MADRLNPLDVSFLYLEGRSTPMHVGGLAVFELPADGFDYDKFVDLIEQRISLVPRYRQKIKSVPGHLANPVWVDDTAFDLGYHVRRSALPRPGSEEQLKELVARVQSRPLDRNRPLWEMYLVEGMAGGRFAVIHKTHHAMVDGINAIDIGQVILDVTPVPRALPEDLWMPRREPGAATLVMDAVTDLVRRPTAVADTVRMGLADARSVVSKVSTAAGGLLSAAKVAARPAPASPLNASIGAQRRFAVARTDLDDYKRVRKGGAASLDSGATVNGGATVNDVVLATVTGAIRGDSQSRQLGNRVSSYLVDLPVGESNPIVRLSQVSYAMKAHKESGQSVGADALVALSGFAPPTLHALGARAANSFTRRLFNVVVTNVPGPQFPLYASGAKMLEMFPVVPLANGQAVSIGLTSYDGGVYFGLNADRDAMFDVDVLGSLIEESLAELVEATSGSRKR